MATIQTIYNTASDIVATNYNVDGNAVQTIYNVSMSTVQTIYKPDGDTISTLYDVQTNNLTTAVSGFFAYTELVVSGSGSLSIPGKQMVEMVVLVGATQTYKLGTTAGGSEIISRNMTAGRPAILDIQEWEESDWTLHFTGTFTAYIYFR